MPAPAIIADAPGRARVSAVPRLFLLPGMGADARMHAGLRVPGVDLRCLDWSAPGAVRSLADYAALLVARHGITADDAIGGSSFGGMVAAEIAHRLGSRHLVLLGSCLHPRGINPLLLRLARIGGRFPFAALLAPSTAPGLPLVARMAAANAGFIPWACSALARWPGVAPAAAIHHLHGARDRVIPPGRVRPTRLVPTAGHLLALEAPAAVSAFLHAELGMVDRVPGKP